MKKTLDKLGSAWRVFVVVNLLVTFPLSPRGMALISAEQYAPVGYASLVALCTLAIWSIGSIGVAWVTSRRVNQ